MRVGEAVVTLLERRRRKGLEFSSLGSLVEGGQSEVAQLLQAVVASASGVREIPMDYFSFWNVYVIMRRILEPCSGACAARTHGLPRCLAAAEY